MMNQPMQVTMNPAIQVGSTCQIQGLHSQPAYNGHSVTVMQFDQNLGRFMIQPAQPNSALPPVLALLPQNLVPVPAAAATPPPVGLLQPGMQCYLHGLQTAAFNGQLVTIVQYLPHEQRYQVQPNQTGSSLPQLLHIKPENLRPPEAPVVYPDPYCDPCMVQPVENTSRGMFLPTAEPTNAGVMRSYLRRAGSMPSLFDSSGETVVSAPVDVVVRIPKGTKARLQGLRLQPSLNESYVDVLDYINQMGRYRVSLKAKEEGDSARFMVVQPQNLQAVSEEEYQNAVSAESSQKEGFPVGSKVVIKGLLSQPHVNGTLATVQEFIRETGRCCIQTDDDPPQVMMLLPKNLERCKRRTSLPKFPSARSVVSGTSTISSQPLHRRQSRRHSLSSFVPVLDVADASEGEGLDHISTISVPEELVATGTRVVLRRVPDKPKLAGELATILQYLPGRRVYRVRLLGMKAISKHGNADEVNVPPSYFEPSPVSAFWVTMTLKGQTVRIPASCELIPSCKRLRAKLDAFAGLDRVVPAGKLLLGEGKCDWTCSRDILSTLSKNPTPPLKCVVPPSKENVVLQDDEVLVEVLSSSNNVFFKAMVEYELLRPTGSRVGKYQIYKVCFPIASADDDENPFAASSSSIGSMDPVDVVEKVRRQPATPSLSVCSSVSSSSNLGSVTGGKHSVFRSSPRSVASTTIVSAAASMQSSKRQGRRHSLSDCVPSNDGQRVAATTTTTVSRGGTRWID